MWPTFVIVLTGYLNTHWGPSVSVTSSHRSREAEKVIELSSSAEANTALKTDGAGSV